MHFARGAVFTFGIIAAASVSAPVQADPHSALRLKCYREVGAYPSPSIGGWTSWHFAGGIGSPQWQAWYNCIDRHTNGRNVSAKKSRTRTR